ncbi:hypothetical protein E5D57_011053 [Metarhizium anisopliae]|nr:hypothetical protein E5D57_011053 [Metarhizium anisopliae]
MVRLSFIMSSQYSYGSFALAVQGIQAAPAVRNNNIERRDSVIQRAEKIPVSYPGGYKKRDNSRPTDNSVNKKDKPTLAAESTSSSGSDNGSTPPATKPSKNSGSDDGSTAPAAKPPSNSGSENDNKTPPGESPDCSDSTSGSTAPATKPSKNSVADSPLNGADNSGSEKGSTGPAAESSKKSGSDKSSTALAAKSTNDCDGKGNTTTTPNGSNNSGSTGDGTLPQALPTSVPGANVNPNAPTRTPEEEKAVQDKVWQGTDGKAA